MSRHIYEVVDSTNEETYYTLAVWESLEEAMANLRRCETPNQLGGDADDREDYCRVEVRERKLGWGGMGKVVACFEWVCRFDDVRDEDVWTRTETNEAPPYCCHKCGERVRGECWRVGCLRVCGLCKDDMRQ